MSPFLLNKGESEIVDEVRVISREEERATTCFTFSSQMWPALHQFRIDGAKTVLFWIRIRETMIKLRGKRFISYAEKFIPYRPVSVKF